MPSRIAERGFWTLGGIVFYVAIIGGRRRKVVLIRTNNTAHNDNDWFRVGSIAITNALRNVFACIYVRNRILSVNISCNSHFPVTPFSLLQYKSEIWKIF